MEILTSRILLQPADPARSQYFYEHTLGLAIYREWGQGADRGVAFFLGGGLLEVSGHGGAPSAGAAKLILQVRDLTATRQEIAARGAVVDAEPELKPWGLLEMTVTDPDGVALIFVEIPADHPRRRA